MAICHVVWYTQVLLNTIRKKHQCISTRPHSQFLYQGVTYIVHICKCGEKLYEKFPRAPTERLPKYYRLPAR